MKKIISYLNLLCIMAVLLSGCGGEFAENSQWGAASGSAVSGDAVSGSSVSGEAVRSDETERSGKKKDSADMPLEDHQFCSANCLYMADDDQGQLIQYCVKTNQEKIYEVEGILGLLLVEEDRIYYTKSFWNGENDDEEPEDLYRVCSMPIVSEEDGSEKPLVEKEERLSWVPDLGISYEYFYPEIDEESFYYMPYGSGEMIQYDRKTKEKKTVPVSPYYYNLYNKKAKWVCFFKENTVEAWNRKTDEVTNIELPESEDFECESDFTFSEDAIYYSWYQNGDLGRPEIKHVDFSTKVEKMFITEQEIKSVLSGQVGIKESAVQACEVELSMVGDCLYLTLDLEWTKGRCWNIQEVVLSRELRQGSELQYEKELTECVQKYGKIKKGELKKFDAFTFCDRAKEAGGIDQICHNTGSFVSFREDRAYLNPGDSEEIEEETEGEEYIMIDRKTGKCKLVKRGMPEYYEFYYDRVWEEDYAD